MERRFGSRGSRGVKAPPEASRGGAQECQSILYPVRLPISRPFYNIHLDFGFSSLLVLGSRSAQQLQGAALLSVSARRCV